ncbi:MAG TPA: helix-turn-helix transcriptional regulator [Vicinamibacterales bacterium]|nr:helix-turn-helix transcriptional regulator [Vicinamibacterales bacterium]
MPSEPIVRDLLPAERLIFASDLVCIGTFRCRPDDPEFGGGTPCTSWCFVFPRTSVWIHHEGRRAFVGDPTVVSFYNRDDRYARRAICPDGDRADWFAVSPALAVDAVAAYDPSVEARPDRPFPFDHGPASPSAYLSQRAVFDAASRRTSEPLGVDEAVVSLLDGVLAGAFHARDAAPPRSAVGSRDVIEQARALLAADVSARWELGPLARRLGISPFTLCRRFHTETSMTLTEYRMQLRLRTSLEPVAAGEPLTDVALALGFSSHSHFTACFRRGFGAPPSAVRGRPASRWPRAFTARERADD